MKRQLSVAEAVEAGAILFELNSGREGVLALAAQAGLPCAGSEAEEAMLLEWRAFAHAAVLYGLIVHAPNVVVLEYVRATRALLARAGYFPEETESFVDDAFGAYMEPFLRAETKMGPQLFFDRLLGKPLEEVPARTVAVISGAMAMVLAAVLDKWEQYEFLTE